MRKCLSRRGTPERCVADARDNKEMKELAATLERDIVFKNPNVHW